MVTGIGVYIIILYYIILPFRGGTRITTLHVSFISVSGVSFTSGTIPDSGFEPEVRHSVDLELFLSTDHGQERLEITI